MAIVFMDGFDHYGSGDIANKWSPTTASLSMVTGRFGGQAVSIGRFGGASGILLNLPTSLASMVVGFAFKCTAYPSGNEAIFQFSVGGSDALEIQLSSVGQLVFSQGTTTMSPSAIPLGQWIYVEIVLYATSTSTGSPSKIIVEGTTYQTITSFTAGSSLGGNVNSIQLRVGGGYDPSNPFQFDDVYILGIDGTTTGPLGPCRIESLYPNAAGSNTNWTNTGGASNYQSVDNSTPDGDSTYISAGTTGTLDTYAMSDLSSTPTTIFAVQANLWSRRDNTSLRSLSAAFKIGSTVYYSGNVNPFSSYSDVRAIQATSPATSAAWTASEVNGMESGPNLAV